MLKPSTYRQVIMFLSYATLALVVIGSILVYLDLVLGLRITNILVTEKEIIEEDLGEEVVKAGNIILLPLPRLKGNMSLEESIAYRRSIREYLDKPLTLNQLSQLLWAAQGLTELKWGFRASPSAGATYPLEIYVVVAENGVEGLEPGIYHYDPYTHTIRLTRKGDFVDELYEACLRQPWVKEAPVNIVIVAEYERTTRVYGERGIRYVHMEVGHVGQNIYLEATALGLGTVAIGAFYDNQVREILGLPPNYHPLYVMPVGVPVKPYRISEQELWKAITENREKLNIKP